MNHIAIRQIALNTCESHDNGMTVLGDDPRYYRGSGNALQIINIPLSTRLKRDERLAFLSWLFQREITTTKQLRYGEAAALWKSQEHLDNTIAEWRATNEYAI